jgi:hypothetical protein
MLAIAILCSATGCRRKPAPAPAPGAHKGPELILVPSAGDAADGVWARGIARVMARQLDRVAGRDLAMPALVLGAGTARVGWALPSAPLALDQAAVAARRYGATRFVRVHIHAPRPEVKNILMDVFEVDGLKTVFSRVYPWNPHTDLPPLRSATADLAAISGVSAGDALYDDAPFAATQNPIALESFLGYLDNLTLAASARGRPVGAGFRAPGELLTQALSADPGFSVAARLRAEGLTARFDRVLVSEVAIKD